MDALDHMHMGVPNWEIPLYKECTATPSKVSAGDEDQPWCETQKGNFQAGVLTKIS